MTTLRCGLQAGLSHEQLRLALGAQFKNLIDGHDPVEAGPAPGPPNMAVARHACKVPDHHGHAHVFLAVISLLDLYEEHSDQLETGNQYGGGWDMVAAAALVARTPDVPIPEG